MKTKLLFFTLFTLLSNVGVKAHDFEVDGIYYNITSTTKLTVSVTYRGNDFDSYSNEYTGSVTIPKTVTYNGATYSVTSIGYEAFYRCTGLTSVTIPNSVTSIGLWAFKLCSGLESIIVEAGNTKYDSRDNCNAIIETSTNTLIAGCKNTIIPNSVTSIGRSAFDGCSGLTSVTIPNSVTSIGDYAFYWCTGLTSISIPNSVTSIGREAFYHCSGLTSITIPNSVTSIGDEAFAYCDGLTSITIPNSVTSIGNWAFEYCESLTSITIPNSVTSISDFAFLGCTGLTSITIPNSVTSIGDQAFRRCTSLTSITIPNSVTEIGRIAFGGCNGLTSVTIGNSVTSIGDEAFYNCSGLKSVTIPNSVTSIGERAFEDCTGLTSVTIPNSVTSIAAYAATSPWSEFGSILPIASSFALTDGESYTHDMDTEYDEITYTRTFSNTNWQALYVPFEMSYADWQADFEVARLNDVHQWDDDDDGTIDRTELEVVKLKSGKTEANTPYLIRAKSVGEKTITLTNTTLYKAEERSIDCSSIGTKFTFTGTYSGVSGTEMFTNGYYAMGGGSLHQAASSANSLSPYRWYMTVTDRSGNPKSLGEVKVMVFGEDTDGISPTENTEKTENTEVFDLSGRQMVMPTKKGLYIKNGKKVVIR